MFTDVPQGLVFGPNASALLLVYTNLSPKRISIKQIVAAPAANSGNFGGLVGKTLL